MSDRDRDIRRELEEIEAKQNALTAEEDIILEVEHKIFDRFTPRLSYIKIAFQRGDNTMAEGPITLQVGQTTVASVDAFDQNGQPFKGTIPTPSWSIDQPSFDSITADSTTPANEDVTSLAAGVANLTVSVAGPNGPLTDTETITNVVPQVLTSVKINFAPPA